MNSENVSAEPREGRQQLGTVLIAWQNMATEEEDGFNEWYNREHMRDRVLGLPGFRFARRLQAVEGGPKYMAYYETLDSSVFSSEEYLSMVGNPDPNSRYYMSRFQDALRTIAAITVRFGEGEGAKVGVVRLGVSSGSEGRLRSALNQDVLPELYRQPGIVAASLLERDEEALAISRGRHLRSGDSQIDWAVLVEASDIDKLKSACASHLEPQALFARGAAQVLPVVLFEQIYRVAPRPF